MQCAHLCRPTWSTISRRQRARTTKLRRWEVQSEALMLRELRERVARGESGANERFNAAESAMSTLGAVARWDLYNRAGAHDLIVFHGGGSGGTVEQKRDQIDHGYVLYGGYSWTP